MRDNPIEITLWPSKAPGVRTDDTETGTVSREVLRITNVSVPQMTIYSVAGANESPAILVFPGGGYGLLAYDKEGTEIASWLNSIGLTAAIVKYRVPRNREGALMDAQRAMGIMRHRAKEFRVDTNKIGVIGFSAGGHLAARLSTNYLERTYKHLDSADKVSCRPDFSILIYPAYLNKKDTFELKEELNVTPETPPAILIQTQDDSLTVKGALAYYSALISNNIPAALHLFTIGGHGYGMRKGSQPVRKLWPLLVESWLNVNVFINK